ncbi:DUF2341 domain-containing protein, partial [Candidatus Dojkabacteria bacterium]|nr:DUF2341 domain-containing protein [Candidatus Dojkabacteria bacterium]
SGTNFDITTPNQVGINKKDNWYNTSWTFRKKISIYNTSGSTLTNFQVPVFIDTESLILSSKLNADCSDLHFTDSNNVDIPYWIATAPTTNTCDQIATKVWLNIPTISTSGEFIYMYYDNPSATLESNGNNVFIQFTDFTTGSSLPSGWIKTDIGTSGSATVGSGVLTLTNTNGLDVYQNVYQATHAYNNSTINGSFVAETYLTSQANTHEYAKTGITIQNSVTASTSNGMALIATSPNHGVLFEYQSNATYPTIDTSTGGGAYTLPSFLKLVKTDANLVSGYSSSNGTSWTKQGSSFTPNGISADQYVTLFNTPHTDDVGSSTFKFLYIRKYLATEPSASAPYNEESSYNSSGSVISSIYDTGFVNGANWGVLDYNSYEPANTSVKIKVRTSNNSDMSGATDFSLCDPVVSGYDISSNSCVNDLERYIQYQITLAVIVSNVSTSPLLTELNIEYVEGDANITSPSYWVQSDWSGGDSQTQWIDATSYYEGSDIIDSNSGQLTINNINFGDGADGAIIVASAQSLTIDSTPIASGRTSPDAVNFNVYSPLLAGSTTLDLGVTPTGLDVNDEILIINLRGTSSNYADVGKYETKRIIAINGTVLTLDGALSNTYDGFSQKIMVQRVPNYTDVTIQSNGNLTTSAYDNTAGKGGVLFFRVSGTLLLESSSSIDTSELGYAGGINGIGGTGGVTYNGVGGTGLNSGEPSQQGGAGGAGASLTASLGTVGGGGGGGDRGDGGGGGGGGGYGTVGTGGIGFLAINSGCTGDGHENGQPGNGVLGGNGGYNCGVSAGGGGGGIYGSSNLSSLYLGSGGGGGGNYNGNGGIGGNGGGIIYISANTFNNSAGGTITNNGGDGTPPTNVAHAGGGGGAGGSIIIRSNTATLGTSLLNAAGGAGEENAGDGGDGRIAIVAKSSISGSTSPSYSSGITEYARSGTITSSIFDTTFDIGAQWGILQYVYSGSTDTNVYVKVRTSNDANMTGADDFSTCSAIASGAPIITSNCVTDADRYIQYQVELLTNDSFSTPALESISIEYLSQDIDIPVITLDSFSPNPTTEVSPIFTGNVSDNLSVISSVEYQIDSTLSSWSSCTADDNTFNSLNEDFTCAIVEVLESGQHIIYFKTTDSSGNTTDAGSYPSITFQVLLDGEAPELTVNSLPYNPISISTPSFNGQAIEAEGTIFNIEFQIDSTNGSWSSCFALDGDFDEAQEDFICTVDTILNNGTHRAYFRATDSNAITTDNSALFTVPFNVQVNTSSGAGNSNSTVSVIEDPDSSVPEIKIEKDINNPNVYLITVSDNFPLSTSNVSIIPNKITVIAQTCTKPNNYTVYCILEILGKGTFKVIATDSSNLTKEVTYEIAQDDDSGVVIDDNSTTTLEPEVTTNTDETSSTTGSNTTDINKQVTDNIKKDSQSNSNVQNSEGTDVNPNVTIINDAAKNNNIELNTFLNQTLPFYLPMISVVPILLPVLFIFLLYWIT